MSTEPQEIQRTSVLILPSSSARDSLNPRQQLFCQQYVKTRSGTKAARLAGYAGNAVTLGAVAYENLNKPQLKAYIGELFRELHIGQEEALAEIGTIARAKPTAKGAIRASDKLKALDLAGKYLQLWDKPDTEPVDTQQLAGELAQMIVQAVDRIKANTLETVPELAQGPVTPAERRLLDYQTTAIPAEALIKR